MTSLKGNCSLIILIASCLFAMPIFSSGADEFVDKARQSKEQGDIQNAVSLYKKALKLDDKHINARRELRDLMIESRRQNPHEEITEAELGLFEEG